MAESAFYIMLDGNKDIFNISFIRDNLNNLFALGNTQSSQINIKDKTYSRTSSGHAGFIVKFDSYGIVKMFNWINHTNKQSYVKLYKIINDTNDNIYVIGHTNSPSILINNDSYKRDKDNVLKSSFIIKFEKTDKTDKAKWFKWIEGDTNEHCNSIICDKDDNIYIVGKTNSTSINIIDKTNATSYTIKTFTTPTRNVSTSPTVSTPTAVSTSPTVSTPTAVSTSTAGISLFSNTKPFKHNEYTGFLIKIDSNGNTEWIKWIEGTKYNEVTSIILDSLNNIYIAGVSKCETIYIGDEEYNRTEGDVHKTIFLAKFNTNGKIDTFIWIEGDNISHVYSLACDTFNKIYLLGTTRSNNIIIKEDNYGKLNDKKNVTPFIVKFNDNKVDWLKFIENNDHEHGHANDITTDNSNNIYITGSTSSETLIIEELNYKNISDNVNAYIIKMNYNGGVEWFRWVENYDPNVKTFIKDIIIDTNYFMYINCYTNGKDIYFNNEQAFFSNTNMYKSFILKYNLNDILNENESDASIIIINNDENIIYKRIFYLILFILYVYIIWILYKTIS
jgi:hypothetical protein